MIKEKMLDMIKQSDKAHIDSTEIMLDLGGFDFKLSILVVQPILLREVRRNYLLGGYKLLSEFESTTESDALIPRDGIAKLHKVILLFFMHMLLKNLLCFLHQCIE